MTDGIEIHPKDAACLHCWFVAAVEEHARRAGLDIDGEPSMDVYGVVMAAASVAISCLRTIQAEHPSEFPEVMATFIAAIAGGTGGRSVVVGPDSHAGTKH